MLHFRMFDGVMVMSNLLLAGSANDAAEEVIRKAMEASKASTQAAVDLSLEQMAEEAAAAAAATQSMNPHEAEKKESAEEAARRVAAQWIRDESGPEAEPDAPAEVRQRHSVAILFRVPL